MERFINLVGGKQNLPPKMPPPPKSNPAEAPAPNQEEFDQLPSVDEALMATNADQEKGIASTYKPTSQPVKHNNHNDQPDIRPNKPVAAPVPRDISSDELALDARAGEPAPRGMKFCPFLAVTKFCYKFAPRNLQQPLATAFFDGNKVWNREWDL